MSEEDDTPIISAISRAIAEGIFHNEKVIILSNAGSTDEVIPTHFQIGLYMFELVYCSTTYDHNNGNFKGDIFSRHGKSYSLWYYQDRFNKITIQSDTSPKLSHTNKKYTLAYVRIDNIDEQSYKNKFLQLLGGQLHIQCDIHKLPLITSHQ